MKSQYHGYRFPPAIISHSVWLYHRFTLSLRDIEDLLAERGIVVSYETVRQWCGRFGPAYANRLRRRGGRCGDTWYLDEVVIITISSGRRYLWRAVDQDGDVVDILVQERKDKKAATRVFRTMLKHQGRSPRRMVTDKLPSYGAARRDVMPSVVHCQDRYANNRCEDLINTRGNMNGRCGDSSPRGNHSDSFRFTAKSTISFVMDVTFSERHTIGCFVTEDLRNGRR